MANNKVVLHHLENSQSHIILWLLEELEIDYELRLYKRQTTGAVKGRAPDEIKSIHPRGKSPTLVTLEGEAIIERSAIALYLINTFDKDGRFKTDKVVREDMLTNYAGASVNCIMIVILTFDILQSASPWLVRPMMGALGSMVKKAFRANELTGMFDYLELEIGDGPYFCGSEPVRADFMVMWPVDFCHQRGYIDLKGFPKLRAWYERCKERKAWGRALEKGNGYDMKAVG